MAAAAAAAAAEAVVAVAVSGKKRLYVSKTVSITFPTLPGMKGMQKANLQVCH